MRSLSFGALALLALGSVPAAAEPSRIEALFDLSTPEAAVEAYVDAFADDDYVAVYFLLDPQAHELYMRAIQRLQLDQFSRLDYSTTDFDDPTGLPTEYAADLDQPGFGPDVLQLFDYYMALSDREGAHLIDFDGDGGLFGEALSIGNVGNPFTQDDRVRAWVETTVQDEGPVRFLMQESPSGRWRVLRIVARAGADDEAVFLPENR